MKPSVLKRVEPVSSSGRRLGCPACSRDLVLVDLKDGDQGYWCMACERGWRIGHLPENAFYAKGPQAREAA
ncbi:MAG TPA: hypothetical protein VNT60_04505 [Deinococcales bacterium]|nr:hypothetical protein [Deinococcales bacterium]